MHLCLVFPWRRQWGGVRWRGMAFSCPPCLENVSTIWSKMVSCVSALYASSSRPYIGCAVSVYYAYTMLSGLVTWVFLVVYAVDLGHITTLAWPPTPPPPHTHTHTLPRPHTHTADHEGLYRLPGVKSKIEDAKSRYDKGTHTHTHGFTI